MKSDCMCLNNKKVKKKNCKDLQRKQSSLKNDDMAGYAVHQVAERKKKDLKSQCFISPQ